MISIEKVAQDKVSELGFSPGTWSVTASGSGIYSLDEQTGTNRMYANIFWVNGIVDAQAAEQEMKANATVMSASKELLAAVFLAKEFESHAGGTHLPANAWFKLHEALASAIEKATGRKPS